MLDGKKFQKGLQECVGLEDEVGGWRGKIQDSKEWFRKVCKVRDESVLGWTAKEWVGGKYAGCEVLEEFAIGREGRWA